MVQKYRKKIVAGNWKMNKSAGESDYLAQGIKDALEKCLEVDVVLCPPFTSLKVVGEAISDSPLKLGAQNMHWESEGAYTGEISPSMLRALYCHYVILGHSERRQYFGETDRTVNLKLKAAMAANLVPIVCVGESLAEREAGQMLSVVEAQLTNGLAGIGADEMKKIVIAYEPIWAIGTGRTAAPEQAQEMHKFIRDVLSRSGDAQATRIQYGGSVKPSNAKELFSLPDIDGGLIGGASLEVRSFVEIVRAAV